MRLQPTAALALLLVSLLPCPPARAAEPPVYQVEMLIFTHEGSSLAGGGQPAQPLTVIQDVVELGTQDSSEGASFSRLPSTELELATASSILEQSGRYEVIEHLAWRQPGLDESEARPVRIRAGTDYRRSTAAPVLPGQGYESPDLYGDAAGAVTLPQLDGTVKLALGQYLHLYTDLVLRKPVATANLTAGPEAPRINALHQFPIEQHRRMRSRELHYLDHPLLGILVQITPVQVEPEAQSSPTTESSPTSADD
jgi:hypothetical protein